MYKYRLTNGDVDAIQKLLNKEGFDAMVTTEFPKLKEGKFNWFQRMHGAHKNNDTIYEFETLGNWVKTKIFYYRIGDTAYLQNIRHTHYD